MVRGNFDDCRRDLPWVLTSTGPCTDIGTSLACAETWRIESESELSELPAGCIAKAGILVDISFSLPTPFDIAEGEVRGAR